MEFRFEHSDLADDRPRLLAIGDGTFKIKAVKDRNKQGQQLISKSGAPKVIVEMSVTDCQGNKGTISEHLTAKMGWKLGRMLRAIGKGSLYTSKGIVDMRHLIGGVGDCAIGVKNEIGFPASSFIATYYEAKKEEPIKELPADMPAVKSPEKAAPFPDDDIPF